MTRSALTALGFAAALSACPFGPDGKPPMLPPVPHYGVTAQPTRTVTAEGVSQNFDAGAKPVPEWWKLYRSEPLNALVDEGLRDSRGGFALQEIEGMHYLIARVAQRRENEFVLSARKVVIERAARRAGGLKHLAERSSLKPLFRQ